MLLENSTDESEISIVLLSPESLAEETAKLGAKASNWVDVSGFTGRAGSHCVVPDEDGAVAVVLFGFDSDNPMGLGKLARQLQPAVYKLQPQAEHADYLELVCLGWCLGGYHFERYKGGVKDRPMLICPDQVSFERVGRASAASALARDLINTPANDMGPAVLEATIHDLGGRYGANVTSIVGDDLLVENFPMIHAVGRAAEDEPRLVDLTWGRDDAPKVTLVGKGVCFDTGGLDLKPSSAMLLMKKDMGGAANVLGLAMMIMDAGLDVRLRVLIPSVENAVSSNSFRPGDILQSRAGKTVEIGNTDAEGRLVLADALTLADDEEPELLLDMATLTGAARVALGPDLPPFYSHDQTLIDDINEAAMACDDPLWNLPLWSRYDKMLSSKIADVNHISSGPFAGSITAALFLARFVNKTKSWVHLDIYGWNPADKPQSRSGGEAQGIRALFDVIEKRFGA